jgi:hypothetical protein
LPLSRLDHPADQLLPGCQVINLIESSTAKSLLVSVDALQPTDCYCLYYLLFSSVFSSLSSSLLGTIFFLNLMLSSYWSSFFSCFCCPFCLFYSCLFIFFLLNQGIYLPVYFF